VRLVACPACKTHLDVAGVDAAAVVCPCGATVEAVVAEGVDGTVRRCGGCGASLDERAAACGYCHSPVVREPRRLSLVCPECLARNPEIGRFCTSCGTEFLPQEPVVARQPRQCPACEETLVAQRVREVWVLSCSWCDGLWVPAASFDALVRRVRPPADAPIRGLGSPAGLQAGFDGAVVYRRCPDCRQRMVRKNYGRTSGVIVDWCGQHGTWFDADELGRVASFVAGGQLDAAASATDAVRMVLAEAAAAEASPWMRVLEKLFDTGR
jgi:Zn-finger nucleic acid-binding protein/ribosomal protein L40E